jgi:hypothetical protein
MEMTFERGVRRVLPRSSRRISRAQWWFDQMRRVVRAATDWAPAPSPRPEQTFLMLTPSDS